MAYSPNNGRGCGCGPTNYEFTAELEAIFKEEFLTAAPLYSAATKVKLPVEDKRETLLYRGSLTEETRKVQSIADYELLKEAHEPDDVRAALKRLAAIAGAVVDGLIRLENVNSIKESDPRQTTHLRITDIFEHADGHRNLQIILTTNAAPSVVDPAYLIKGWIAYRFYFSAAAIHTEYQKS